MKVFASLYLILLAVFCVFGCDGEVGTDKPKPSPSPIQSEKDTVTGLDKTQKFDVVVLIDGKTGSDETVSLIVKGSLFLDLMKKDITILEKPRTDNINNYVIHLVGYEHGKNSIEVNVMYAFSPRLTYKGTYDDIETISADISENMQRFIEDCQDPNNFRGAK